MDRKYTMKRKQINCTESGEVLPGEFRRRHETLEITKYSQSIDILNARSFIFQQFFSYLDEALRRSHMALRVSLVSEYNRLAYPNALGTQSSYAQNPIVKLLRLAPHRLVRKVGWLSSIMKLVATSEFGIVLGMKEEAHHTEHKTPSAKNLLSWRHT
ncbi:hypothetical protein B0O99DRAFT_277046 [Bisporella sp. PMI_857]|nr:hypothetical protein B0O99DRAFT_277046 [Bisporella sp. PMI_857]